MAKKKKKKQTQQFLSPGDFLREKARSLEMGDCYVTEAIRECGEGFVLVSRQHKGGKVSFACFLVDVYCLGVKDSYYKLRMEDWEFQKFIEDSPLPLRKCSYEEAHNWIYGSVAYADEAGILPDRSFSLTQYMLEEDTDEIPLIEHEFGLDGKHHLVAHSNLEASRYLPLLEEHLGEDNYTYMIRIDGFGTDEEDYDDESYDDEE